MSEIEAPRYEDLAAAVGRLAAARGPRCGSTTVVAVDGRSGSGKTRLVAALAPTLGARVLSLEDVYRGWHGLEAAPPLVAGHVLARLASGRDGSVRRWDWAGGRVGAPLDVPAGGVLVLDGVGSGAAVLRPWLSALVWLEAPAGVRRERALSRDGETYAPWWDVWAAQEDVHLARERTPDAADLVLDTHR